MNESILLTGGSGFFCLRRARGRYADTSNEVATPGRPEFDLLDLGARPTRVLKRLKPEIIN